MTGPEAFEQRTLKRIWWRCMPLMTALLFFSFLDRVNIGFAALRMNQELGLSNTVFGVGIGLLLHWLCRIWDSQHFGIRSG